MQHQSAKKCNYFSYSIKFAFINPQLKHVPTAIPKAHKMSKIKFSDESVSHEIDHTAKYNYSKKREHQEIKETQLQLSTAPHEGTTRRITRQKCSS